MCTILTVAFLLAAAVMVSSTLLPDIATGSTTYPYETMETWTGPLEAEGRGSNNTLPPTYISGNESVVVRASRTIYYRVGMSIQRYYLPVIVPIGLVGNTLALFVLVRPKNRASSCYLYMAVLAVSDNCLMVLAAYYWLISEVLPKGFTEWECKILVWLFQTLTTLGTWLVVVMTIDRSIAIRMPLKASALLQPNRAYLIIAILVALILIYSSPHVLYTSVLATRQSCAGFTTGSGLFGLVYSWANLFINCLLPFSTIFVLNSMIISKILERKYALGRYSQEGTDEGQKHSREIVAATNPAFSPEEGCTVWVDDCEAERSFPYKKAKDPTIKGKTNGGKLNASERQLIVMLMLVTFSLLILTLPQYIRYTVYEFLNFRDRPESFALYVMMFHITQKMYYTNSAVNFFLYCISGSRFRADLRESLTCSKQQV